jgi:hypothetical protein
MIVQVSPNLFRRTPCDIIREKVCQESGGQVNAETSEEEDTAPHD